MPQVDSSGVNIHFAVEGEGFPVVLHTGGGGDGTMWAQAGYVDGLYGFRWMLIDHRGHGQSDKPGEVENHLMECYVSDVIAVLDSLEGSSEPPSGAIPQRPTSTARHSATLAIKQASPLAPRSIAAVIRSPRIFWCLILAMSKASDTNSATSTKPSTGRTPAKLGAGSPSCVAMTSVPRTWGPSSNGRKNNGYGVGRLNLRGAAR
jgi:hypothetical protein